MTQIIEIEGDQVRLVERQVSRTVTLTDLLPHLETRPPVTLFHPRTAVYTHWDETDPRGKVAAFLCELPPGIRSIVVSNRRYRLAMPWTYFLFSFVTANDVNIGGNWQMGVHKTYHTNQRVTGLQSRLWTAFVPNVYEDGNICFGTTGADTTLHLADRVDTLVNTWYLTQFNHDVIGGRNHPMPFNSTWPTPGFRPWVEATSEHGAGAWNSFPEWNITNGRDGVSSFTVEEILTTNQFTRPQSIHLPDEIPAIQLPMTFGRAEEWLRTLTPLQRRQIMRGMENIATVTPDDIAPATALPNTAVGDDGGEPI